jgi:hypothetical protein
VSGDDVTANQRRDAQHFPPAGAGTARGAGNGSGGQPEVRWVGEQRLMEGYCGRAVVAGRASLAPAREQPRPVAVLQRPRGHVVRIGPPPLAPERAAVAQAA